jgi:hypothetical protein
MQTATIAVTAPAAERMAFMVFLPAVRNRNEIASSLRSSQ